jgi:hypothetical protein
MIESCRGQPYQQVDPKRSWDKVEVSFDWHDFLASKWSRGITVTINSRIRLTRAQSRGVQFRATNDGVTGRREPPWPTVSGQTVLDGTVVWEAEPVDNSSLQMTIASSDWPAVSGLTLSLAADTDLVYQILVEGGTDGQDYDVRHRVTLSDGQSKESVAVLPVRD